MLQAPQLARLQLRLVPVRPSFIEITSHKVVRASYSAAYVLPLTMNEAFSVAKGAGSRLEGDEIACPTIVPGVTVVSTIPDPAALRKSRRE
jgi:hypothetical protein